MPVYQDLVDDNQYPTIHHGDRAFIHPTIQSYANICRNFNRAVGRGKRRPASTSDQLLISGRPLRRIEAKCRVWSYAC